MKFDLERTTDRAQVGIGTLIVFIAMVLVAAIAAGVLVNTAGFLQSSAQETGQKSSDQVTNRLEVVDAHGILDSTNGDKLSTLNLTVRRAAGSEDVDLEQVTMKYRSDDGEVQTLTYASGGASGTNFGVQSIQDTDGSLGSSPVVINSDSDRAQIVISPSSITGGDSANGLPTSTSVTIEATTESGATTTITFTTPDSYSSGGKGDPVPLSV